MTKLIWTDEMEEQLVNGIALDIPRLKLARQMNITRDQLDTRVIRLVVAKVLPLSVLKRREHLSVPRAMELKDLYKSIITGKKRKPKEAPPVIEEAAANGPEDDDDDTDEFCEKCGMPMVLDGCALAPGGKCPSGCS